MTDITTCTSAKVFVPGEQLFDAGLAICWCADDPLAVRFEFTNGDGSVQCWTVSRDLMIEGAKSTRYTGIGDVLIRTDFYECGLYLHSPEGKASVMFDRAHLDFVLAESIRECRPGTCDETDAIAADLESALAELLDGAV